MLAKEFGRTLRPNMIPFDIGRYTVDDRPGCYGDWQEGAPRRRDIPPPSWKRGGVPTCDMTLGTDTLLTLATKEHRPFEVLQTEQGPIQLPYGPAADVGFMPSVVALQGVPFFDSRRTAISDRYYKP